MGNGLGKLRELRNFTIRKTILEIYKIGGKSGKSQNVAGFDETRDSSTSGGKGKEMGEFAWNNKVVE